MQSCKGQKGAMCDLRAGIPYRCRPKHPSMQGPSSGEQISVEHIK